MKILTTAILLFVTLLAVPLFSYFFGTAPGSLEWKAIFTLIKIGAFVIAYTFIVGELTKNYSQADKLWSIVPVVYVWVVAGYGDYSPIGFPDFMVAGLMLFFIVYEMVADVQQWNFQSKKYSMIRAGEELSGIYKKRIS
jgi:steroid 5-alpha reductase family enzyme